MLSQLSHLQLILATLTLVVAYWVRGITGFGSGLIAIPILALMLPLTLVVPLIGLLDYLASLTHGVHHRRDIQWGEIIPILPFSIAGVVMALYLLQAVDAELLRQVLGVFILTYAAYSFWGAPAQLTISRYWGGAAGGLGGVVGTLFGTGGPFYVIYLQMRGLGKQPFRATMATIFLLDGASRIVGYTLIGLYSSETLLLMGMALPLMLIALYLGGRVHTSITPQRFRQAIALVLLGSGLALLSR